MIFSFLIRITLISGKKVLNHRTSLGDEVYSVIESAILHQVVNKYKRLDFLLRLIGDAHIDRTKLRDWGYKY